jgi:hypothetical protein
MTDKVPKEDKMTLFPESNSIVGAELTGFKIAAMAEVFRTDDDGRKTNILGYFKDADIAKGYIECQADSFRYGTETVYILTDGKVGFLLASPIGVDLLDDEEAKTLIRETGKAKLTPTQRKIMGLE